MSFARVLPVFVLLVVLTGCSRIQLAYSQLDWLIPYYLEDYVTFTDEQRRDLDGKVHELLTWHCATQLSIYADMLRAANSDFQARTMTEARLAEYAGQLQERWRAIKVEANPAIGDLLVTMSDEQVRQLFVAFEDKNQAWLEEYSDQTAKERRERYEERMTEELERWFGPLGARQQRLVRDWSERLTPLGLMGLQARQRWQAHLRQVMENRAAETAFRAGIERLFVNPRSIRSPDIQQRYDDNRAIALDLVSQVGAHITAEQRVHLARETASMAADLDDLVCAPEAPGARTQGDGTQAQSRGHVEADP